MDPYTLVTERVAAGADFVRRLHSAYPLEAAAWVKESETGYWYLYLVPASAADADALADYRQIVRIDAAKPNPYFDVVRVKLQSPGSSASDVLSRIRQWFPPDAAVRCSADDISELDADEAYVYPLPAGTVAAAG